MKDHAHSSEDIQQENREGVGDDEKIEEEGIQANIKDIFKSGDLSPRSISKLNKEKKKEGQQ